MKQTTHYPVSYSAAIQLCMHCFLATLLFPKFLEQIPVGTFHKLYPLLQACQLPRLGWCNRYEMASQLAGCALIPFQTSLALRLGSGCSPCSTWVTLLRGWLLSMCSWFNPRQERGEGRKLYCYTGNTKVPIRTSNSQKYMKYKWYREKQSYNSYNNYNLKLLTWEY